MNDTSHETGFNASLALFALMGLLLIWSGFHNIIHLMEVDSGDCGMYELSKAVLSCFVLILSIICLSRGKTLVAIMSMTIGLSSFMFFIGDVIAHTDGLGILDLAFAFPLALCAFLVWRRNGRFQSAAITILAMAIVSENLPEGLNLLVSGILLMVAGLMFIVIAARGFRGVMRLKPGSYEEGERSSMVLPCLCLGSIQLMMTAIPFETGLTDAVGAMSSLMIALMSVSMMMNGSLARGILMFLLSVSDLMWSICGILGSLLSDLIIPVIVPAVMVVGTILWKTGDRILSMGSAVLLAMIAVCLAFESDIAFSLGFAAMSVSMMATAVMEYRTDGVGRDKVPLELERAAPVLSPHVLT